MHEMPTVYSQYDRHQLLMQIASMVRDQVEKNPQHGAEETIEQDLALFRHMISQGK